MDETSHPQKRRRVDDDGTFSFSEASSDELGANSDIERRRESWAKQAVSSSAVSRGMAHRSSPQHQHQHQHQHSECKSESPDELAAEANTAYWQQQQQQRTPTTTTIRRRRTRSMSTSSRRSPSRRTRRVGEEDNGGGGGEGMSDVRSGDDGDGDDDESRAGSMDDDDRSMRSRTPLSPTPTPTPPPPPPPPKPEKLHYKEKFVLRGHQRGVSAAKFSPDGAMIASCGRHIYTYAFS